MPPVRCATGNVMSSSFRLGSVVRPRNRPSPRHKRRHRGEKQEHQQICRKLTILIPVIRTGLKGDGP